LLDAMRRWLAILVIVGAWPFAAHAIAEERPLVAVLEISGVGGPRARNVVVRAIRDRVDFVPRASIEALARELDLDLATIEGRARAAEALAISVLVVGEIEGRALRANLSFYGADGEELASRTVPRPVTSSNGRRRLATAARRAWQPSPGRGRGQSSSPWARRRPASCRVRRSSRRR
jgi:hypothetical protein